MFDIFENKLRVHFVGIGGIGVSGIAEIMHQMGYYVTGSDQTTSKNTERLEKLGIKVAISHNVKNVDADIVVYSSAINPDNVELQYAREHKIPLLTRAEMLSQIVRFKKSIVVAGSHGKTTTTSLCAAILDMANFAPTVVNGGIINSYQTNAKLGESDWCVIESDESDGSFTLFFPTIGIITNIDNEHINNYGSFEKLKQAFKTYVANIPFYGCCIACIDDPVVDEITKIANRRIVTYGIKNSNAQYIAKNIIQHDFSLAFDVVNNGNNLFSVKLPLLGTHNVKNALAAIATGLELKITPETIISALMTFAGINRRFTIVGRVNGVPVIDDYAHHPTEIAALLEAANQFTHGKIVLVCQPHRFSRLQALIDDFVKVLQKPDIRIITPVYMDDDANHEINSKTLFKKLESENTTYYAEDFEQISTILHNLIKQNQITINDVIIFAGAGSISKWAHDFTENYNAN